MSSLPLLAVALLASPAAAQTTSRPVVPSSGLAAEGGPGALWVNPANLSYDPDPRYALFVERPAVEGAGTLAATAGAGGFGLGVRRARGLPGVRSEWTIDQATALSLPGRVGVGLLLRWHLVDDGDNYLGYDAALSWRPLPWLGLSGVARHVGAPDPAGVERPETGAGIALRPFGPTMVLGLDYARILGHDEPDHDRLAASVRLRPIEGLYLRGGLEADLHDGAVAPARAGLGVELYFDGFGAGYHHAAVDGADVRTAWLGTDEPGESFVRSGRRVPALELDAAPEYEPRVTLVSLDPGPSWLETLERIRRVEDEPGVRGLVLTLDGVETSWARLRELRQRVVALEAKGRPVLVLLEGAPSNGAIYVASAASRVVLHPASDLGLTGVAATLPNARGALDLVGVEPQFVRREAYKSAPETFTRTEPSGPSLEQTNALVDDLYDELVGAVAEGRGLPRDEVEALIDRGPLTGAEAEEAGLVDALAYPDQLEGLLAELHDGAVRVTDLHRMPQPRSAWEDPSQIALVYVDGVIVPGESSPGGLLGPRATGADTVARALERAEADAQVRAIVLRVDSPGGSAYASDVIWRAVERVREAGKPVVVSMGGVAASGGYYVAAGADAIWAEPTTITGSIGVYSGKLVTGELLDTVGVRTTVVQRGRNADLHEPTRRWDDVQRARMQALVDDTYDRFLDRVADGRGLEREAADAVAGGRVWSGRDAREVGLVDELGGLQDAIADARRRAGLPDGRKVGLVSFGRDGGTLEALAPGVVGRAARLALPRGDRADLARLDHLLEPLSDALLWTLYPNERVWLLDPTLAEIPAR